MSSNPNRIECNKNDGTGLAVRCGMPVLFLLLFFFSGAQAPLSGQTLLEQRVSLTLRSVPLEAALQTLSEKSGVSISFSSELLPPKLVSARFQRQPVAFVLDNLLAGAGLAYRVIGNQIVIFKTQAPDRKYTINGFLYDAASGEPLIGATIWDKRAGKGTESNAYGFFSLTLTAGEVALQFSYLGYEFRDTSFLLNRDTGLSIYLNGSVTLKEVVVRAPVGGAVASAVKTAPVEIADVEVLPALGGESDVVRTLQLMPGVQTGADGAEGLHVRGGAQGHNLVLIDGVPVYNYGHAAGIFSVFNTTAVRSMRFIKGGFPARYGGRLASVLDVRTKEGNTRTFQGQADIGLLSTRLTLEGPLVRDKSAFFISGRTSHINRYLRPLSRSFKEEQGEQGETLFQFDDLNAKVHYAISQKDKLFLSFYKGRDHFKNQGFLPKRLSIFDERLPGLVFFRYDRSYEDAFDWGNTIGSLRWNRVFGKKLFVNTTATFSRLDVNIGYKNADSLLLLEPRILLGRSVNVGEYTSGIEERGLRFDADFVPSPGHYWRFGAGLATRNFRPGALVYDERTEGGGANLSNDPSRAGEFTLYIEDEFRIGKALMFNAGFHFVNWKVKTRNHTSLQPRLSLQWQVGENIRLRAAHSSMAQFLHLLTNSDIGLPTDLWVPSTDKIAPERALQNEIGADFSLAKGLALELDVYHKRMRDLPAFTEGASILNDWEQNVTIGEGQAYGVEALLQYRSESSTAWISYGLARSERRFDRINLGRVFPFKYDRRHDLKIAAARKLRPWLSLSANWVFSSGFAYSLPLTEFTFQIPGQPGPPVIVQDFGAKNRYRMPWHHRLDLNAQCLLRSRRLQHTVNIGVYNAYNRRNPLYYNIRTQIDNVDNQLQQTKSFVQVWLLPALPSLSYSLKF